MTRLKWSLRRKWRYRSGRELQSVYVSINSGITYWITGKPDPKRRKGRPLAKQRVSSYWWCNWTVYRQGEAIGTWPFMVEARHEAQKYHDREEGAASTATATQAPMSEQR